MQSASARIWTPVTESISYDHNHYTTGTSKNLIRQEIGNTDHIWYKLFTMKKALYVKNNFDSMGPNKNREKWFTRTEVRVDGPIQGFEEYIYIYIYRQKQR